MTRYADYRKAFPQRTDEQGRNLCRWCGAVLSGRAKSMCSERCRREVLIRCGLNVSTYVHERDRGVCARCGLDCDALGRRLKDAAIRAAAKHGGAMWYGLRSPRWRRFMGRLGLPWLKPDRQLWEAHHKVAVADGGGACGLDGYETLCHWCHARETAEQKARWARERRCAWELGQAVLGSM